MDGQMVGWTEDAVTCNKKKVGFKSRAAATMDEPCRVSINVMKQERKKKKRQTFQSRCTGRFVQLLFAAVSLVPLPVSHSGQGAREGFGGFGLDPSDGRTDGRTDTHSRRDRKPGEICALDG